MLKFRYATDSDVELLYEWANDPTARENSYNKESIPFEDHKKWFDKGLCSGKRSIYIFTNDKGEAIGQVRIEYTSENEAIISISVDINYRKNGYAVEMLNTACADFKVKTPGIKISAYIFKNNIASYKCFIKAGFEGYKEEVIKGIPSYILYKI
ncbi:hypothetical protein DBR11_20080 [Pedobacter sp. HMWF019]|uniref:GNAT family N-acetyltransferase n=1 Tax=Pedobacter sp. HMWF019 TaxID=2056856 RepID=UPI000D36E8BC|nr:GNAT family N-acetyltransferase [Pedobacter sp. HMWF019]PTS95983.1 hypothetical protein DBR11_20080 [Pedobacter sp. HMWF019]